jgi:hypothetical protein
MVGSRAVAEDDSARAGFATWKESGMSARFDWASKPYDRRVYWEHVLSEALAVAALVVVFFACGLVW